MQQSSNFNPNRDLQRALANLEAFSQQIENEPLTQLSRFTVKEGKIIALSETALSKVISLAYSIVSPGGKNEEQKVLEEVLESSNVLRSYLPLFQMLEEGNFEQQKFVAQVKGAIARFNKVLDSVMTPPPTLTGRIVQFFYEDSRQLMGARLKKIDFPQKVSLKIDFPQMPISCPGDNHGDNHWDNHGDNHWDNHGEVHKIISGKNFDTASPALQKIANLQDAIMPGSPLSKQTLELYAMKVISLLGQRASLTHADAQIIVDKTAKQVTLDKQKQQLTIYQQLEPMPGQQFDIAISFRADPLTSKFTIPVLTYQIFIRETQSGFPHPLQHNGWALSDSLIIPSVPNPHEFPFLEKLHSTKQLFAMKLLPAGELAVKARKMLRLKRATFTEHKTEFLALFQRLSLAIGLAAQPGGGPQVDFQNISKAFFTTAAASPYPYDFVADAHQLVLECTLYRPQKCLQKFWLENTLHGEFAIDLATVKNLFQKEFESSLTELQKQKDKSDCLQERCILEYCYALSLCLFEPISKIALQPHAQILKAPIPVFDPFTKKLQAALYQQLAEFQKELHADLTRPEMKERLKYLLENDLALFETGDFSTLDPSAKGAIKELQAYYS